MSRSPVSARSCASFAASSTTSSFGESSRPTSFRPTHIPRALLRSLGWIVALLLIGASLWYLRGQLPAIRRVAASADPEWTSVAASMAVVLGTYALLIECWRRVLAELGGTLSFPRAAVIWLGSNLARYLPLSGWQFALMTMMAKRRNVPVAVSAGASVLLAVVNVITGLVVFGLASAAAPSVATSTLWLVALAVVLVLVAPLALPHLGRILRALSGREITLPTFTFRAVAIAAAGTSVAWLAYGGAFWLLARGVLPTASPPALAPSIAVYTGAYLAGLLAIVPPAGLGAAEYAMIQLAGGLALFGPAEIAWLAIVVRLWRTVLEIVPGVIVLGATTLLDRREMERT